MCENNSPPNILFLRWLYIITVKHRTPHILYTNDNLNYTDLADNYTESNI